MYLNTGLRKKPMKELIEKLNQEHTELYSKLTKLRNLLASDKLKEINPVQQSLLKEQASAMQWYSNTLVMRIQHLKGLSNDTKTSVYL